jgi:translation initiation factor IF-3
MPNRGAPIKEIRPPMNDGISAAYMRVVTPTPGGKDQALGVMSRAEALQKAKELGGLDLIMINDKSDPPVCKIVDYSKYRYMLEKKAKEVKKNSKANEVKEVKMSYKIDVHDYDVRKKMAQRFIRQGNRVRATVMFRGREVQHEKLGFELLDKLAVDLDEVSMREGKAKREGRNLSLLLGPRIEVLKAVNEYRKSQDKLKKQKKKLLFEERKAALGGSTEGEANGNVFSLAGDFDEDDEDMDDDFDQDDDDVNAGLTDSYDDEDDDEEEDGDQIVDRADDDDSSASLDELLGSSELIDDLFSKK